MKILKMGLLAATAAIAFGSVPGVASAAALVNNCTLINVEVTSLTPVGTNKPIELGSNVGATQCTKIAGNDFAPRGRNLGEFNDGLLNGEDGNKDVSIGDPIAFLNGRPLIDADRKGDKPSDPGWIYLGKQDDGKSFEYAQVTSPFAPRGRRSIADFVTFEVMGSGKSGAFGTSGTWKLTPSATIVKDLQDFIGSGYFDSLAIILKASNEFVVYDLDFSKVSDLDLTIPYVLTGTWNTGDMVNNKGKPHDLSHFSVWARDPEIMGTSEIPEPTTLALFGLSLLGIGAASRRRKI